jgi:hypothetical protein
MDADWAYNRLGEGDRFEILTAPENLGWVLLPDGTEQHTVGQAHTMITLSDGKDKPIIFVLLPHCHVSVVLGQSFIHHHKPYTSY